MGLIRNIDRGRLGVSWKKRVEGLLRDLGITRWKKTAADRKKNEGSGSNSSGLTSKDAHGL